ncbi:MAG TPA: hypothetical protein VFO53_02245 [Casimicrobiaceae bacterium]|nr:hypothetical protein [Casimicrobiaceae bacterium]
MFLGHFGVALAARHVAPRPSLGTSIMAAQWADGIWPLFVLLGLEHVEVSPGITRVTPLDFVSYPYTHSLLADGIWAVLFALVYGSLRRDWRGAGWLAVLVLSHWVLDVVAHRPDMPTWPGGPVLGLGLWNSLPGTLIVEFALFASGAWLYARATRLRDTLGRVLFASFCIALVVIYLASVFGPPPPGERTVAIAGVFGWLFVAWGYWIDRHRTPARAT